MKLSDYAKKKGISYKTAWRWFMAGLIKGYQMPTGTIIVEEEESPLEELFEVVEKLCIKLYGEKEGKGKAKRIKEEILKDV